MTTTTFENARVGDRVWDFNRGWGTISQPFNSSNVFKVEFANDFGWYDNNGMQSARIRTLFWDEIRFEPPPQPKRKVKKWMRLYKNGNGRWDVVGYEVREENEYRLYPKLYATKELASAGVIGCDDYAYAEVEIEE